MERFATQREGRVDEAQSVLAMFGDVDGEQFEGDARFVVDEELENDFAILENAQCGDVDVGGSVRH